MVTGITQNTEKSYLWCFLIQSHLKNIQHQMKEMLFWNSSVQIALFACLYFCISVHLPMSFRLLPWGNGTSWLGINTNKSLPISLTVWLSAFLCIHTVKHLSLTDTKHLTAPWCQVVCKEIVYPSFVCPSSYSFFVLLTIHHHSPTLSHI